MDISPSAQSPDARETDPSFRKPANEVSHRNYRRHSPLSSHSRSPSSGAWKPHKSPSLGNQEDEGSKKVRNFNQDGEKRREDARFQRGTDGGLHGYGNNSREWRGRAEDYNHTYNRRHPSYHDKSYHNSRHVRADHAHYDEGRYAKRSPERSTRERTAEENGYRRRENRGSERDRDRDDRFINARPADRDRNREDKFDGHDRYKSKDQETCHGQERFGGKERDDYSDVEVGQLTDGKWIDNRRDAVDVEGRVHKVGGKDSHMFKADAEKSKESRRREMDNGKELDNEEVEGDCHKSREKRHKGHDEHQRKTNSMPDRRKDYSSNKPEDSKKEGRDKENSGENVKSKFSSVEPRWGPDAASDHSNELERFDDKHSKGSKWGTEANNTDATGVSSDPEVAKMAAMKAAALVNMNLGGIKSVDEKKKLLWGSKGQQRPVPASGANRWEAVRFADSDRQDKFQKLMSLSVLLSYLYPTVGCQRRCGRWWPRECGQFVHVRNARRTATGFGKAIYGRPTTTRWSDCWIGSLVCDLIFCKVLRKASRNPELLEKQCFAFIIVVLYCTLYAVKAFCRPIFQMFSSQ